MQILIALAGITLALVAYIAYPLVRAIKVGEGILEQSVAYEQRPQNATMRILVAGDSTGVGAGAVDPKDSIAGRIGQDFPNAEISNISENGLRLAGLLTKLQTLGEEQYDLIVLQIGANDVVQGTSKDLIEQELNQVLDAAEAHGNRVILLTAGNIGLAPAFRQPIRAYMEARTRAVRTIFMNAAAAHDTVEYVDLFEEAKDDKFGTDIKKYYAPDHFHPSGAGYGLWYEKVQQVL